jgi:hypothetical protein
MFPNGIGALLIIFTGTLVDVKWTFSQGQLLLSHVCNRLSVQSMQALLCVGVWSLMGHIKDKDVRPITMLPEVDSNEEEPELAFDWDAI